MENTIWKFVLNSGFIDFKEGDTVIEITETSQPLSVGLDPSGELCVWILMRNMSIVPNIKKTVYVRGTGHGCSDVVDAQFLGSVLQGPYMWHVFIGR